MKITQNELQKIVNQALTRNNIFGVIFHVETEDAQLILSSSAGNLDIDTKYYLASINKLVSSFLVHRLCVQNKLKWTDKIADLLPDISLDKLMVIDGKDYSRSITLENLLAHSSGLPCYLIDKDSKGIKNMEKILNGEDQSWPIEKVLAEVKQMRPKFKPGTEGKASYSETNYRLLDKILEQISNKNISQIYKDLFDELGMNQTLVLPTDSKDKIAPVFYKGNSIEIANYCSSTGHDIASTAKDQVKLLRAFFNGKQLPKSYLSKTIKWNSIFFPFKYGVGVQKFYIPRILSPFKPVPEIIGHCGSVGSVAFYIPQKGVYITGTINQTSNKSLAFQTLMKIINKI